MKFSVIIPLYNKERHIATTINSILSQTYTDFEVIVVDDGSTDESVEVVENIGSPKLQLFQKQNGGTSTARNYGFRKSKGEYLCFLDADDHYLPHFLENINALIEAFPEAGIYGANYVFQKGERKFHPGHFGLQTGVEMELIKDYFESVLYGEQVIIPSSSAIPRSVFEEVGGFDESIRTTEDQLLFNSIALHRQVAFHHTVSSVYNQGAENMKTHRVPKHEIEFAAHLHKMITNGEVPEKHLLNARKIVAANLIGVASMNILAGDKTTARKFLKDPRSKLLPERRKYWVILLALPTFLVQALYAWRKKLLNKR